jgi:hypothetical protein
LVILAVIVVLSLVVVSLVTTIFSSPAGTISSATNKLNSMSSAISIMDSITDSQGGTVFRLKNNSGEKVTLTKVTIDGVENDFSETINLNDAKTFSLNSLVSCSNEKKTYTVIIYYTTQNGLTKQLNLGERQIDCTTQITTPPNAIPTTSCFETGSGTLIDPKIICDCNGLQNINNHTDWDYALGSDINCYETRNWNFLGGKYLGFSPITSLSKTLDGKNHTINGLYMNHSPGDVSALVLTLESGAKISNLNLSDANYIGYQTFGLISDNSGDVNNVNFSGNLNSDYEIAGLVAANYLGGTIRNSSTNVTLKNNQTDVGMGGLVIYNGGDIYNSHATGSADAKGIMNEGGLAAQNANSGRIYNSYASMNFNNIGGSPNMTGGGLVGINTGNILNSYSTSIIYSTNAQVPLGGLVGESSGGDINNSYAAGSITCTTAQCVNVAVGGLVGRNSSRIYDSFTATALSLNPSTTTKGAFVGLLEYSWSITNSFFDINKTVLITCDGSIRAGCTGKNATNTEPNYFFDGNNSPMGPKPTKWDFTTIWNDNNTTQQYPTLK